MDFLQKWWISESVYIFTNMQLIAYKVAIEATHSIHSGPFEENPKVTSGFPKK